MIPECPSTRFRCCALRITTHVTTPVMTIDAPAYGTPAYRWQAQSLALAFQPSRGSSFL